MEPEIVERQKLLLAGITNCGRDVADIDIKGLWTVYLKCEPRIPNRVKDTWYELHVGSELGNGIYSVVAGAGVSKIGELPVDVSLRIVPAGKYAHFVHRIGDGGFKEAFARAEAWMKGSGTEVENFGLQLYDRDFDPQRGDSILHIYIPLKRRDG